MLRNAATTFSRLSARILLPLAGADGLAQGLGLGVEVEILQQSLDRFGAHAAGEVLTEPVAQLPVEHLVRDQLLGLQLAEGVEHLLQPVDLRCALSGSDASPARRTP